MNISNYLKPKSIISEEELSKGLRWLTWEGTVSLGFTSITTSGILVAFALAVGANNFHIGILAAIPFIMQIIQIPSIWLVERFRRRKIICVVSWFLAQLLWFPIALIPIYLGVPGSNAISMLLGLMALRGLLNAICNSAWNGWIRDLVPQQILGRFFSKRLACATFAGVIFSLGAAFFIDYWNNHILGESAVVGYTYVLLFGASTLGLASPIFMALMPEPLMQPIIGPQPSLMERLSAPFRDTNFRRLILFLFFWGFASNLAIPFFAVHMLQRLGLPLAWVIGLSVLSQMFNIVFLRVWGPFADRFGNKPVLSVSVSLYLLVIFGWIFTTMPERYFLTVPLLIILHIFAGIAAAGVNFTVGTIGLKLAPQGESTSYLVGASIATNIGAGVGPLLGGFLADFFSVRQLSLTFTWIDPTSTFQLSALSIIGRDFLFGIAFLVGLFTLSILALVREEGEMGREVILESLMSPIKEFSRPMSSVPSSTFLSNFPFGFIKKVPVPGLDVAIGVTTYQIAEMAKTATTSVIRGRRLTRDFVNALARGLSTVWHDKEKVEKHGIEITRHTARGAFLVVDNEPLTVESLVRKVMQGVTQAAIQGGVNPEDAIIGVSQGIIQAAAETDADLIKVTEEMIKTAKKLTSQTGVPEDIAVNKTITGIIEASEILEKKDSSQVRAALSVDTSGETES